MFRIAKKEKSFMCGEVPPALLNHSRVQGEWTSLEVT
jgi:hypothetical protein